MGSQITLLRKNKGFTQAELGERLGVSFQAVSKWERGETLPDTAILPDLAAVLDTTVDFILSGGAPVTSFRGVIHFADIAKGLHCLESMGKLLGRENLIYQAAVQGINSRMNTDVEAAFGDETVFEAFVAEAIIQNVMTGAYMDVTKIRRGFRNPHFRDLVLEFCARYGIR